MFKIYSNNKCELTRGDTARISVTVYQKDKTIYELQEGDVLTFTLKKSVFSSNVILEKKGQEIVINPDDTKDLDCGKYVYDVTLVLNNQDVHTIIPGTSFKILPKVGEE